MNRTSAMRVTVGTLAATCAIALSAGPALATGGASGHSNGTHFYIPEPQDGARQQIAALTAAGNKTDAALIRDMIETPQAVWINGGVPDQKTEQTVKQVVQQAAGKRQLPVLVLYNIPFRDCAQFSAGGATTAAQYQSFVQAVAAGIGDRPAVVLLEPDSLGIIPWYTTINGAKEWCQPAEANAATAAADRFAMLNKAVDTLKASPHTTLYLDGTHSGWLGVGDISDRLVKAGVQRADGFFLNASNYQTTEKQLKFGDWISQCIWYGTNPAEGGWRIGHFDYCASQYYPASAGDFSTWGLTDAWYAANVTQGAHPPAGPADLAHFVIDTSRNGQGPWTPPAGVYPDAQDWCNPPGRGLGYKPTTATGDPLADAFLWVKIPGASDGSCNRGIAGSTTDPEWGGITDPAAGVWFPQMALDLVHHANPPLTPDRHRNGHGRGHGKGHHHR